MGSTKVCAQGRMHTRNPVCTWVCNSRGGVTCPRPLPSPEGTDKHGQGERWMAEIPGNSACARGLVRAHQQPAVVTALSASAPVCPRFHLLVTNRLKNGKERRVAVKKERRERMGKGEGVEEASGCFLGCWVFLLPSNSPFFGQHLYVLPAKVVP